MPDVTVDLWKETNNFDNLVREYDVSFTIRYSKTPVVIQCEVCRTVDFEEGDEFCTHTENAVKNNSDSKVIWNEYWYTHFNAEYHLRIPIFPTVDIWTEVKVVNSNWSDDQEPDVKRLEIFWKPQTRTNWLLPERDFLLYLNEGEGRGVIREALLARMQGEITSESTCQAAHHGYLAQRAWDMNIRHKVKKWHEWWSLFETGWCRYCNEHSGMGDDLIPDADKRGVWS